MILTQTTIPLLNKSFTLCTALIEQRQTQREPHVYLYPRAKAIRESECKTDIPESLIVISPFCLTNPIMSHSPDTSSCSSVHSGSCTDEEILQECLSDLPDFKTVELCDVSGRIEE